MSYNNINTFSLAGACKFTWMENETNEIEKQSALMTKVDTIYQPEEWIQYVWILNKTVA